MARRTLRGTSGHYARLREKVSSMNQEVIVWKQSKLRQLRPGITMPVALVEQVVAIFKSGGSQYRIWTTMPIAKRTVRKIFCHYRAGNLSFLDETRLPSLPPDAEPSRRAWTRIHCLLQEHRQCHPMQRLHLQKFAATRALELSLLHAVCEDLVQQGQMAPVGPQQFQFLV